MKTILRKPAVQAALAACTLANFLQVGAMAQGTLRSYYANDPVGRNVVTIESRAPLETMVTTTGAILADVQIDPANVLASPKARFEVDLTTLDTGIALRNEHLRSEGWLDTAKYPKAVFTFEKLLPPVPRRLYTARAGEKGTFQVEGTMELHGVKKPVRAQVFCEAVGESEATKARLPGELGHIRATFPIKLDEFGVKIPEMAKLKVANEQQVTVDVFVSTGSEKPNFSS